MDAALWPDLATLAPWLIDAHAGIVRSVRSLDALPGWTYGFVARAELSRALADPPGRPTRVVFAGGQREDAALSSAIRAAIASYAASAFSPDSLTLGSLDGLAIPRVDPAWFPMFDAGQHASPRFSPVAFERTTPLRWVTALAPLSGQLLALPACFAFDSYRATAGQDVPLSPQALGGLSAHTDVLEASVDALLQAAARDLAVLTWETRSAPPQLRIETLSDANYARSQRFERAGHSLRLLDSEPPRHSRVPRRAAQPEHGRGSQCLWARRRQLGRARRVGCAR